MTNRIGLARWSAAIAAFIALSAPGPQPRASADAGDGPAVVFGLVPSETAFTYQGRLTTNDAPANGSFTVEFRLFDSLVGGSQVGPMIAQTVIAEDGLFSERLDFGAAPFATSSARWLELAVGGHRPGGPKMILVLPRSLRCLVNGRNTATTDSTGAFSST